MLAFFEREIGLPYTWAKYYQVCVDDFGGGMDNTSITPLTVRFHSASGLVDRQVMVKEKTEDFHFALGQSPKIVRLDPET